jgi:hypothetical protein
MRLSIIPGTMYNLIGLINPASGPTAGRSLTVANHQPLFREHSECYGFLATCFDFNAVSLIGSRGRIEANMLQRPLIAGNGVAAGPKQPDLVRCPALRRAGTSVQASALQPGSRRLEKCSVVGPADADVSRRGAVALAVTAALAGVYGGVT